MRIATREVSYDVDGLNMVAHLARPEGEGRWPAVLVGHDGVGLDDYQRSRADELAAHGYVALAMDYHGGQKFFGKPEAMLARTMPLLGDPGRMQIIGRTALHLLLAEPDVEPHQGDPSGFVGRGGTRPVRRNVQDFPEHDGHRPMKLMCLNAWGGAGSPCRCPA